MRLSKSQFVLGLQCPKAMWLYQHRRWLMSPAPPRLQGIFDRGHEVGEEARTRFPGGRLIAEDHEHIPEALEATARAVSEGVGIIYEAAALFDGILIRADILERKPDGGWDLIEVKSSRGLKDAYLHDLAIQVYTLRGAGFRVERATLMHLNPKNMGESLEKRFAFADMTERVEQRLGSVASEVRGLQVVSGCESAPVIGVGRHCDRPYECRFKASCLASQGA